MHDIDRVRCEGLLTEEEAVLRLNNIKTLALPSSCSVTDNPGTLAARV